MPDERTGSKFTWFNSALRGSQLPQTLVDMIQVGEWYSVHAVSFSCSVYVSSEVSSNSQKPDAPRRKEKRRPTVKFRDIEKDLLRKVSDSAAARDKSQDGGVHPAGDVDESSSDESDEDIVEGEGLPSRHARTLLPSNETSPEINLRANALLDLLSDQPIGRQHLSDGSSGSSGSRESGPKVSGTESEPFWGW